MSEVADSTNEAEEVRDEEIDEIEEVAAPSSKKGKASGKKVQASDAQDSDDGEANGDGSESEESEYEIESILEAQIGYFKKGKYAYFVSWKGYSKKYNSWVDEDDAEGARELITEFWANQPKKGKGRKSVGKVESASNAKSSRSKSKTEDEDEDEDEDEEERETRGKRSLQRGRKSKGDSDVEEIDVKEVEKIKGGGKKTETKSNRRTSRTDKKNGGSDVEMIDADAERNPPNGASFDVMKKYMNTDNWEDIVVSVETVERTEEGDLLVYFTTKRKESAIQDSRIMAERAPLKMIKFYESHLKWRIESDDS